MRTVIRLVTAAVLGYGAAVGAQDGTALPAPAADYLARATAQGTWPQLSAVYLSQSAQSLANYPAGADAPDAGTPVALGDAAAALTGLLHADLASSGRVRLDDPIRRYLPDGVDCVDARVCDLTLQELATQTSGLPPLPTNLFPVDGANVWRDYRESDLLVFLANYRLPAAPLPRDSPLGNVLLAWLLGRAHGEGYATALAERVTRPLGLGDTRLEGGAAGTLPTRVRSSVGDLSRLLRAMLRPAESPLRAALMLSRQQRDPRASWGLGWRIATVREDDQEWPLVWQSAQVDGAAVFVGFRTDHQQAAVFAGSGDTSLAPLGLALLKGGALPPLPATPVALAVDPAEYAGLYESSPGEQLLIRAASGGLSLQSSGRLSVGLKSLGPDLLAVDGAAVRLSFQRDASGRIDALRLSENGVIVPIRRLSTRVPNLQRSDIALSADKRRDYCGDYAVDADVVARLHCGDALALQFSGTQRRELFAYAEDRFASRDGELELIARRSTDGQVNALTLVLLGRETTLARTQWLPLPPAAATALADERRQREAAARDATTAVQTPAKRETAPWTATLPVLPPANPLPYRAPGTGAAPAATPPATRPVAPAPAVAVPATRTSGSANVRAAPPAAPARVETLPDRFERPRFAPRPEEKAKEASDDGT
jgi:D-alanyl-D-alanine-carboxypeptidase/D-alanyl-D-alanine-endopeptidase